MKKSLRLEFILALLVVGTVLAILFQDTLLKKKLIIDNSSGYHVFVYDDHQSGGGSSVEMLDTKNFKWKCELKGSYNYPYCGFEIAFDSAHINGLDLRNFTKMRLSLDYSGPSKTIRVFLRNYDEAYTNPQNLSTTKWNQIEFDVDRLKTAPEFSIEDFFVADWWRLQFNIPPQLSHPQFNNIVILDIQTGSATPLGIHEFQLHQIELTGHLLNTADWYLAIIILWLTIIVGFLVYRIVSLRDLVLFQRKRETALLEVNGILDARSKVLELKTQTDFLTGAFNRRAIESAMRAGLNDWRSYKKPLSLVMIDIDHFKRINDTYGHDAGDKVLSNLATAIQEKIRTQDLFARWGGEEFVLLCRDTDTLNAHILAEKLRILITELTFDEGFTISASFGVSTLKEADTLDELFKGADKALYRAKNTGRNCVVVDA